ncbi:30S ribosomal protein S13 [Candidatus Marinamargulisbacteria bacterium SCGC AG-410-N11]|nr:30S ribosomal protein S13 [Candidatus Marinamargulisbacteria bacterium SCGC AG-410-N11]
MARLAGIDLPRNKDIVIALTYIFGIGLQKSKDILKEASIDENIKTKDISEDQIVKLRSLLREYPIEGDLKRQVSMDIKRLKEIGSYRGERHKRKLPCRGQRTHTNARTKRGKKIAVAGKKKVTK